MSGSKPLIRLLHESSNSETQCSNLMLNALLVDVGLLDLAIDGIHQEIRNTHRLPYRLFLSFLCVNHKLKSMQKMQKQPHHRSNSENQKEKEQKKIEIRPVCWRIRREVWLWSWINWRREASNPLGSTIDLNMSIEDEDCKRAGDRRGEFIISRVLCKLMFSSLFTIGHCWLISCRKS